MNVLVLAPHPDDETIGCGGSVCLHARRGDRVTVVFLTSGELGLKDLPARRARAVREREAQAAAKRLGIARLHFLRHPDWFLGEHITAAARDLRPILLREQPDLVYAPHEADAHPDHQATLSVLRSAARRTKIACAVRAYEVWTPLAAFDHVEDISRVMTTKLAALREHRSQLSEFDYLRAVRGLNAFRGELAARCRFAEAFQTVSLGTPA